MPRGGVGARTVAHPEQLAPLVPDAIAGAFEHDVIRQLAHGIDQAARLQRAECGFEMRLLAAALRVAEARQQHLAVEHDGGVGGEHEIGQARRGRNELDRCAKLQQLAMQRRPFAAPPRRARAGRRPSSADPSTD